MRVKPKYVCTIVFDIPSLGKRITVRGKGGTEEWARKEAERLKWVAINQVIMQHYYYDVEAEVPHEASTPEEEAQAAEETSPDSEDGS